MSRHPLGELHKMEGPSFKKDLNETSANPFDSSPSLGNKTLHTLYDLCHPLLLRMRSNRWLIRKIFDVRIPEGMQVHFDPTTIGMVRLLRRVLTPSDRCILELGIGEGALISLALAKKQKLAITGVDCSTERVRQSLLVAKENHIDVDFFQSDLFGSVNSDQKYDLIFMNPPYVPTQIGERLKLDDRFSQNNRQAWDGGADGLDVLHRFLAEAPSFLSDRGRIVFGLQSLFVPKLSVIKAIQSHQLQLIRQIVYRIPPCVCWVVGRFPSETSEQSPGYPAHALHADQHSAN